MITIELLRQVPWLDRINDAAVRFMAAGAVELRFAKQRVLYTAGSMPAGLLVILKGRVRVIRGRGGRQQLVHEEGPGGTLGEIPVFADGAYPATAVASEPVTCVLLPTES